MADIINNKDTKITSCDLDTITVSIASKSVSNSSDYTFSENVAVYDNGYAKDYTESHLVQKYYGPTTNWRISVDGTYVIGSAETFIHQTNINDFKYSYIRRGEGTKQGEVYFEVQRHIVVDAYSWELESNNTIITTWHQKAIDSIYEQNASTKVIIKKEISKTVVNDRETKYEYQVEKYTWKSKRITKTTLYDNKTDYYYPHPASFSFTNCVAGNKWRIDEGINSLITNINSFQGYAKQRMAWKGQATAELDDCPSLFNSDNRISAVQLNAVYKYLGKTTSYQSGEKLSAAMLTGIADLINDKE